MAGRDTLAVTRTTEAWVVEVLKPAKENHQMIHIECPWCTEPAPLEASSLDLACDTCGIVVEVAPDPVAKPLDRAA
jgi:hypothetical protein